jgi:hypothetical protein
VQAARFGAIQRIRLSQRTKPGLPESFAGINVANPGDFWLVHQKLLQFAP